MTRTIVIGDVHGCLTELDELLHQVEHRCGADRLVFCGDLVDRGPDSLGVVRRAMEIGAESVMGNHEAAHVKFRERVAMRRVLDEHRRRSQADFMRVQQTLGDREWAWLASLPNYIHLDERWTVVHAGCKAGIAIEEQDPGDLQHRRYVRRDTGKRAPLSEEMRPSTHAFWTDLWTGPRSIVYGHHVERRGPVWSHFPEPRFDEHGTTVYEPAAVGIDTGCAYGGALSAVIFDGPNYQTLSVPAQGKWADLHNEKWIEDE